MKKLLFCLPSKLINEELLAICICGLKISKHLNFKYWVKEMSLKAKNHSFNVLEEYLTRIQPNARLWPFIYSYSAEHGLLYQFTWFKGMGNSRKFNPCTFESTPRTHYCVITKDHSSSRYAKLSEKLTFVTSDTHTYVCVSGSKKC